MCECCLQTPCHSRCPNADVSTVGTCECCGEDIAVGEEIVVIGDDYYHYDCVNDMTTRELLELFDVSVREAEVV